MRGGLGRDYINTLSKDFMKKLISKIMAVVVLFSLIALAPQFTQKASAAAAPTVSQFYIDAYSDNAYTGLHERNDVATIEKSNFPLLIDTYQLGYGSYAVWLDGTPLSSSEFDYKKEPIESGNLVVGWNTLFSVNPHNLYNGTHQIKIICIGIGGNIMSDSISFNVN